jgi:GAF domain-containing protein
MLVGLATGETVRSELDWFLRRDGSMFPVSYVSAPVAMTQGRGAVVAFADIEDRRRAQQVLREHDAVLVEQQASLRRVAAIVAEGTASAEVFAVIARESAQLLGITGVHIWRYERDGTGTVMGAWSEQSDPFQPGTSWPFETPSVAAFVQQMKAGRPVRLDNSAEVAGTLADAVRESGIRSAIGVPIVVGGEIWGMITGGSVGPEVLPDDIEDRLADFTELVATAIANAESRAGLSRLAEEQAALRRVATVVARGASQREVFAAIAEEVGQVLGAEYIRIMRYEDDNSAVVVASAGANEDIMRVGSRVPLGGEDTATRVFRTRKPARIDDYRNASGAIAQSTRSMGARGVVATPVIVEGRLWGAMGAGTAREEPLPPETESRLGQFTELMATAIANTESHAKADRLAVEQAGLRRVATLVAKGAPSAELFAKVVEEVANVLDEVECLLVRDEGDGTASVAACRGAGFEAGFPVGMRLPVDGDGVTASVLRTGEPWRTKDYSAATGTMAERAHDHGIRSGVGCPIRVGGRIWGVIGVARSDGAVLPPETETRITQFSDLVATAIANAAARTEVERLAEEQAALRRVATLVAEGASATTVFDAVAAEMEGLLDADAVGLSRYEGGGEITVVAHRGAGAERVPPGSRVSHEGQNIAAIVRRTEQPARIEHYEEAHGALAEGGRTAGIRAAAGAPIVVDGRLWGTITVRWVDEEPSPADTEERMVQFAELLGTAIANADSRDQLRASRARLLTEGDEARRRVVRDLHDGAQQRQVHTIVTLKLAQRALGAKDPDAESLVDEALEHAQQGQSELRELAHGILPSVLTHGGLKPAVDTLVARLDLPVEVDAAAERLPAAIEASAYFIVAEALTNVVKHAHAKHAAVTARVEAGTLRVQVRDDGIGGARADGGGLVGLADRLAVLDGQLRVESPADGGTLVAADIPVPG